MSEKFVVRYKEIASELVNGCWGKITDDKSITVCDFIRQTSVDIQSLSVQIYTASILQELLDAVKLITEPIKEAKEKKECEEEQKRRTETAPYRQKLKRLLPLSSSKKATGSVRWSIYHLLWCYEHGADLEGVDFDRARQFLSSPIDSWTDKQILSLDGVGKITLKKFREEQAKEAT